MTPTQYFDNEPSEEETLNKEDIIKDAYKDFMQTLNSVIDVVSVFPPEWHLQMLKGIMEDI